MSFVTLRNDQRPLFAEFKRLGFQGLSAAIINTLENLNMRNPLLGSVLALNLNCKSLNNLTSNNFAEYSDRSNFNSMFLH